MPRSKSFVLLTACFAYCSSASDPSGEWDLWSVDGLPVEEAPPSRFEMPASVVGRTAIQAGDMWRDEFINAATFEVLPEGEYRQVVITTTVLGTSSEFYRRTTGRVPQSERELRGAPQTDTARFIGPWHIEGGDSVTFGQTRDQVVSGLQARLKALDPADAIPDVAALVDSLLPGDPPPRATGRIRGDLLELRDLNGRVMVYRRRR